jgi:predicted DNA-binding WGR domain protein
MKLVCQTKLQFKEGNSDKVYEVDLCEVGDKFVVNFRYGRRGTDLKEGTKTTNSVALEEAEKIFQKLVDEKTRKGYHVVGEISETAEKPKTPFVKSENDEERNKKILEKLADAKAKSNPNIERIIWRAGELKIREAAPHLVKLIGTAKELRDYCIVWSLGFCGDETNISDLEKLAAHKADYVRRISREAIAKIADDTKRNELKENALSKLPENIQNIIKNKDAENLETALIEEVKKVKGKGFELLTRLYEVDDEMTRQILFEHLRVIPLKVNFFKPVRQIFKIAEYRRDAEVFGILAKRFETSKAGFHSSPWGDWVSLQKDDGTWEYIQNKKTELAKEDSRIAFSNKTKDYFQKRTWRTLRRLGEIGDADEYVKLAVGSLLQFSDADALEPKKSVFYDYRDENGNWNWQNPRKIEIYWDKFSPYLLFNHILYENSPRYEYKTGSRGFRMKDGHSPEDETPEIREEAFPKIWEQNPRGLLHLLAESECEPVHEFAVKALHHCREFVENFDVGVILMLLSRPYKITAKFGFEIAKKLYDPANPNTELAVAVATSDDAEARAEGFKWIDQKRELFAKDNSILLKLFTSKHADTRKFAANLLQATIYSETEARNLIAVLISELVSFEEANREIAADLSEAILKSFGRELRTLNFETIQNLLSHPLVEVQEFGGNVLLNHEIGAENLPDELINSLIESEFESIRNIGVKLFGKLPDENLLKREGVILSLLSHELADVYNSTRPIALRLASNNKGFVENISNSIFVSLLQEEKYEGVRSRLLNFLKELPDWTKFADFETAKLLVNSNFAEANEAGGLILQARAEDWKNEFSVEEIVEFSNHEILAIRQTSWQIAGKIVGKLQEEVSYLIRALDAKWLDSREFWREYFRKNFTAKQLTPEILVAICDSVKDETQKFGRDLLLTYFEEENGVEYLLKLSEHPSASMQLFATNYLENYATDSPEKLKKLAPYFTRVLSLVNRSRAAKDRVLKFLENEAMKDEKSAKIAAEIIARQSATLAIGDKAKMIESMLKIRKKFPEIELPIKINQTEVRANVV